MALEDDSVVDGIEASARSDEVLPRRAVVPETTHDALGFDALVFEKASEDQTSRCVGQFVSVSPSSAGSCS